MARDPSDANTCRHNLRNSSSEDTIEELVSSSAPVQLDEHC